MHDLKIAEYRAQAAECLARAELDPISPRHRVG
jgi:hypothetical protein